MAERPAKEIKIGAVEALRELFPRCCCRRALAPLHKARLPADLSDTLPCRRT